MDAASESRTPPRRITAEAKAVFLAALRRGVTREDAAAEAGFSLTGFYGARRRDPAFAVDWAEALAAPAAAGRRTQAYAERGEIRIAPANRRLLQRRRRAHVRFTAERRAACLIRLAETGDSEAAAAAAGVCVATVNRHRRLDPAFGEVYRETLAAAYLTLEAAALHLALIAQARLRHALANAEPGQPPACCPACGHRPDEADAFDRAMRLLARHDRKERAAERAFRPGGRRQPMTFERAIAELERYLRGLGVPILGEGAPPRNGEGSGCPQG